MFCITSIKLFVWFFTHFPTKNLHFLQPLISKTKGIGNFKGRFLKITLPEKPLTVLYTNGHFSKSRMSMNLILVSYESWKFSPYNDTKNSFYLKCHSFRLVGVHHIFVKHIGTDILVLYAPYKLLHSCDNIVKHVDTIPILCNADILFEVLIHNWLRLYVMHYQLYWQKL